MREMGIRGYVLIETSVGRAGAAAEGIRQVKLPDAAILSAEVVTGPYDVIAVLETNDLDSLGHLITDVIQAIGGVQKTTTCLLWTPK
jgi:DNA-binding Lrp family transcriptional regulator